MIPRDVSSQVLITHTPSSWETPKGGPRRSLAGRSLRITQLPNVHVTTAQAMKSIIKPVHAASDCTAASCMDAVDAADCSAHMICIMHTLHAGIRRTLPTPCSACQCTCRDPSDFLLPTPCSLFNIRSAHWHLLLREHSAHASTNAAAIAECAANNCVTEAHLPSFMQLISAQNCLRSVCG